MKMSIKEKKAEKFLDENYPLKEYLPIEDLLAEISLTPDITVFNLRKKRINNLLNHISFTNGCVHIQVYDNNLNEEFLIKACPGPCKGEDVVFRIDDEGLFDVERHTPLYFIIDDKNALMLVPVNLKSKNQDSITITLPDIGYVYNKKQSRRYPSSGVNAAIILGDIILNGILRDFSAHEFHIIFELDAMESFNEIESHLPVRVELYKEHWLIFSGNCVNVKSDKFNNNCKLFSIINENINEENENKKFRPTRQKLAPTPKIKFIHPLLDKKVQFEVNDISAAGFSAGENSEDALLMPGMVIPELTILLAGSLELFCSARIIYCLKHTNDKQHYGFEILDMNVLDYRKLFDILCNASDSNANFNNNVDLDSLWEFFFKSGFIYTKKYCHINKYRSEVQETYKKLYDEFNEMFVNFTYQENGIVYGHCSMLKAYSGTWMVHHLSALPMKGRRIIGFKVLENIMSYYDGMSRMPSVEMDYMVLYFRPENRFSDLFFGGFCRAFNDPRACSLDLFSYVIYNMPGKLRKLPDDWSINITTGVDLKLLTEFYENKSGGLFLDSLGLFLKEKTTEREKIEDIYNRFGLSRSCKVYSLKESEILKAVIIVDQSNIGLNLSNLLNCLKIIIVDEVDLTWSLLENVIFLLGKVYNQDEVTALVYPAEYVDKNGIEKEKEYYNFIINSNYGDKFVEYVKENLQSRFGNILNKGID